MTRYRVIRSHQPPPGDDPIVLTPGMHLSVGLRYDEDPEWPDWYWCKAPDGRQGWVPGQILDIAEGNAVARRDFDARELGVEAGDTVMSSESLNGWAWCETSDGRSGWVPLRHLEDAD